MAGRAPGRAPAPAPALGPSLLPAVFTPSPPAWQYQGPDFGLSLPITKIVTVCLFVAAVLGFIMIALFITFNFYRRRAIMQQRRLEMLGLGSGEAPSGPRREIPIHEGFIVANPCGEEQVAYKLTKDLELTEIVLDSASESETDLTASGRCTSTTSPQTSPEVDRYNSSRIADPPAPSDAIHHDSIPPLTSRMWPLRSPTRNNQDNQDVNGPAAVQPPVSQTGNGAGHLNSAR